MKKLLAILLALVMALSIVACGGDEDKTGEITNKETTTNESDDVEGEISEQEVEVPVIDTIGEAEGNTYENAFLGFGFTLPEGWSFYSKDQINELNSITQDMLDEDIAKQLEEANVIYDMYALDQYGNSVNIVMEKISAIASIAIDEKTYAEASAQQLPEALKQIGLADVSTEITNTTFNGAEHVSIDVVGTAEGFSLYEKIICIKTGQYMVCVTVATTHENTTDAVLEYFYSVEK